MPDNETKRVLCVGDIHAGVTHKDYLTFCKKIKRKYKCNHVVLMGDVLDHHVVSFHDKHPDTPGAVDEYKLAYNEVQRWYKAFPNADVLIGNHDERYYRIGAKNQIPSLYFRDYNQLLDTPQWTWHRSLTIDGVFYHHGHGVASSSSVLPAATLAMKTGTSSVLGHFHTKSGVVHLNVNGKEIFGLQLGCGADNSHPAMSYSKSIYHNVLSCGVVLEGVDAHVEVMRV